MELTAAPQTKRTLRLTLAIECRRRVRSGPRYLSFVSCVECVVSGGAPFSHTHRCGVTCQLRSPTRCLQVLCRKRHNPFETNDSMSPPGRPAMISRGVPSGFRVAVPFGRFFFGAPARCSAWRPQESGVALSQSQARHARLCRDTVRAASTRSCSLLAMGERGSCHFTGASQS